MRALLLLPLLCGCQSMEVTALFGPGWDGYETHIYGELVVTKRLSGRKVCSYTHSSQPAHGWPVDDVPETTIDFAGCGIRWDGSARR